jgi:hypothetical protein
MPEQFLVRKRSCIGILHGHLICDSGPAKSPGSSVPDSLPVRPQIASPRSAGIQS